MNCVDESHRSGWRQSKQERASESGRENEQENANDKTKMYGIPPTYFNVSKVHRQTKNSGFSGESFHLEIIRIFDMDRSEMDG